MKGIVGRIRVRRLGGLSDHKVKCVEVKRQVRRWIRGGRVERAQKVRWERLKCPEIQEDCRGKMRELREEEETMERGELSGRN